MGYKQVLNPITGRFDMVSDGTASAVAAADITGLTDHAVPTGNATGGLEDGVLVDDGTGVVGVGSSYTLPTSDEHIAPKKYVDDQTVAAADLTGLTDHAIPVSNATGGLEDGVLVDDASGVLSAGTSYTAPVNDWDLAPKKYIDDTILLPTTVTKASTGTLSTSEVSGTVVNNYGQTVANTQTLPTVFAGMNAIFQISTAGAGAFNIKAGPSDKIYLNGTALDDGDKISNVTPAVGDTITIIAFQTGASTHDIIARTAVGTWIDGDA